MLSFFVCQKVCRTTKELGNGLKRTLTMTQYTILITENPGHDLRCLSSSFFFSLFLEIKANHSVDMS